MDMADMDPMDPKWVDPAMVLHSRRWRFEIPSESPTPGLGGENATYLMHVWVVRVIEETDQDLI